MTALRMLGNKGVDIKSSMELNPCAICTFHTYKRDLASVYMELLFPSLHVSIWFLLQVQLFFSCKRFSILSLPLS